MRILTDQQLAALRAVPVNEQCPNRVRVAMGMVGVRQDDLVEATGLNKSQISRIVNGRKNTIDLRAEAQPIAGYFGCLVDDLFPVHEQVA